MSETENFGPSDRSDSDLLDLHFCRTSAVKMQFLFLAGGLRLFINRVGDAPKSKKYWISACAKIIIAVVFVQFEVSRSRIKILISLRLDSTRVCLGKFRMRLVCRYILVFDLWITTFV